MCAAHQELLAPALPAVDGDGRVPAARGRRVEAVGFDPPRPHGVQSHARCAASSSRPGLVGASEKPALEGRRRLLASAHGWHAAIRRAWTDLLNNASRSRSGCFYRCMRRRRCPAGVPAREGGAPQQAPGLIPRIFKHLLREHLQSGCQLYSQGQACKRMGTKQLATWCQTPYKHCETKQKRMS